MRKINDSSIPEAIRWKVLNFLNAAESINDILSTVDVQINEGVGVDSIVVILINTKPEQKDRMNGSETGADDYIIKPLNSKELEVRIQNLVKQRIQPQLRSTEDVFIQSNEIAMTSLDQDFLSKAMNLVETNITNVEFTVEMFCQRLALNRNSVHVKLKSLTGYSASQFIRAIKLKKAAELLRDKCFPITEVAELSGFNNRQTFNKVFKQSFKMTPSVYRKEVVKNNRSPK